MTVAAYMEENSTYVVGIGCSAGGLEALKGLFGHMPDHPGVAFVVVQHLAPDSQLLAREVLMLYTRLDVLLATDGASLEPNCIYLIPEDQLLTIQDGRLHLENPNRDQLLAMPIDVFFHSLGNSLKKKAIGLILSGMGSDGAIGIQTIHEQGGLVMIQLPETARFPDMPALAIAADDPDWILAPEQMGTQLIGYLRNPELIRQGKARIDPDRDNEAVQEIIQMVSDLSRINFRQYKLNTVRRRIERRMNINLLETVPEYRDFLRQHTEDLHVLYNELLVGVTSFFRDPKAFEALTEKVFSELCRARLGYDPIRIWVAACSTGEEVYSIAILLDEYIRQHKHDVEYKIFATDLDGRSIEFASYGRYRNTIAEEVSAERLQQYFVQAGEFYEVRKEIRRRIVFAKHNLINDPPFIKLDLLSCRNLFIYLKADLQKKLALNFSYAIRPQGFLFMGAQESPNDVEEMFDQVDHKWKIFQNKGTHKYRHSLFEPGTHLPDIHYNARRQPTLLPTATTETVERYAEMLVNEYAPTCLLVNTNHEVIYLHGQVDRYLHLPRKRVNFDLFNMVPENLLTIFRNGIRRVTQGADNIAFNSLPLEKDGQSMSVDVIFKAIRNGSKKAVNGELTILIEFRDLQPEAQKELIVQGLSSDGVSEREIEHLEHELKNTKKELQYTIDELETINEELQASNEEMLSSNEEMQSANEELQSANEELFTVNTELKNKIDELTLVHNDIKNLLTSTEIATIFLDRHLNIRRFTPSAKEHFHFLDSDLGRPLAHLTHQFDYHQFIEDAETVLETLVPVEKEISKKNGRFYILRVLPYRTEDSKIIGVVLTLLDVTELKEANNRLLETARRLVRLTDELKVSEQSWRALVNNTPDLIARFNPALQYIFVNEALERELGRTSDEILGRTNPQMAFPGKQEARHLTLDLQKAFKTGHPIDHYTSMEKNGQILHWFGRLVPELAADGKTVESILFIARDITALKQYELELDRRNQRLQAINEYLDNFVYAAAHDLQSPVVNIKYLVQFLKDPARRDQLGTNLLQLDVAVERLEKTLNGLVELIRLQNEKENVRTIVFAEVLAQVQTEWEKEIRQTGAVIEADFDARPTIEYVKTFLLVTLRNLLSNALKYHSPNRPPVIRLSTEKKDDFVLLKFEDNGRGIDLKKNGKHLFQPFKRFSSSNNGIGLGLYLVKAMGEKNGGKIEVSSEVDKGIVFNIYLREYK